MMKIGLYPGSFNPMHIGHLALANWIVEFTEIDEVWFLVTPQNPLKDEADLLDNDFRLRMARVAVDNYPRFKVSDFEFGLPRPSYTLYTLDKIQEAYPDHVFHLIIGADNWQSFDRWKDPALLLERYSVMIYPRLGYPIEIGSDRPNVKVVDAPIFDISSTFIRQSLAAGKDVRFFLPEKVWHLIKES